MEEKNKKDIFTDYIEKYKTDKKFKAKVQLIGGIIFIVVLIIYLNIESMNTKTYTNIKSLKQEIEENNKETEETNNKEIKLLEKIDNNYEYNIKVKTIETKETEEETKEVQYRGKSYKNNMEITKESENITTEYYKIDNRYYTKANNNYEVTEKEDIYNIIDKEYIELNDIKEYINKSSLDHVTEYSSGKKEYVYNLKVKDIIKSYTGLDKVEINITEEENTLTIIIDYTNLLKEINKNIKECQIEYIYTNIGEIEEFTIIKNNS